MTKYTEGPWEYTACRQQIMIEMGSALERSPGIEPHHAIEIPNANIIDEEQWEEAAANAQLIAAAPELLKAAEKVISENVDKEIEGLPELIAAADKAKAEGDSNE